MSRTATPQYPHTPPSAPMPSTLSFARAAAARSTTTLLLATLATLAVLATGGCALRDRVVLLPDAQGQVGAVELARQDQPDARLRLDSAYATAELRHLRGLQAGRTDAAAVARDYPGLEQALPARPRQFTVQFNGGSTELTPESLEELQRARAWLATLPAPEVVVTGHTDAVGSHEDNDRLSLQRAERVRDILADAGIDRRLITAVGRGKRALRIETADGVARAENRRVEIKLR